MALRQALPPLFNVASTWSIAVNPTFRSRAVFNHSQYIARSWQLKVSGIVPICITLNIPPLLADIWEAVLRAVPKKKTSHRKKRQRFMAGKALKDVTSLNKCSACGTVKRAHLLCPYCVTAHTTDIYCLATSQSQILSASGSSSIKIYSIIDPEFPLIQTLENVHKLGCHHLVTSGNGQSAASAGFGGEVLIWAKIDGKWVEKGKVLDGNKAGEIWAIALSEDGQYLACTSIDGRINVWDNLANRIKIREFETRSSFGMSIDLSLDGRFTASGHENGGVYIFSNDTGRLFHSLLNLAKPVRAVSFSPGGRLLAAAGDSKVIALYDVSSGEQVAIFSGHDAWILSLDWSSTGEHLLSGAFDGKCKVWSIDRRVCVATHSETEKALWRVRWLPKTGRSEGFVTAGANRSISFYREATGA